MTNSQKCGIIGCGSVGAAAAYTLATHGLFSELVLIDMMFQLGIVGFCGFKKMIAAVKQHDYSKMIEEIKDSLYAKQVPSRAEDNISRSERVLDSVQKV